MNHDSTKDDFLEGVFAIFDKSFDAIYQGFKSNKKELTEEEKMKVITDALKSVREDASLKVKIVDQLLANPEKTKELFKEILDSKIKSEKQLVLAANKKINEIIKDMSEEFRNEAKEKVVPEVEKAVAEIEKQTEELLEKEEEFNLSKDGLTEKEIMYEVYNYLNEDEMKLFIAAAEKSSEALDNAYADSASGKSFLKAEAYKQLLEKMDKLSIEKVENIYELVVENGLQSTAANKVLVDRVPSLEKLKEWVTEIEKEQSGINKEVGLYLVPNKIPEGYFIDKINVNNVLDSLKNHLVQLVEFEREEIAKTWHSKGYANEVVEELNKKFDDKINLIKNYSMLEVVQHLKDENITVFNEKPNQDNMKEFRNNKEHKHAFVVDLDDLLNDKENNKDSGKDREEPELEMER